MRAGNPLSRDGFHGDSAGVTAICPQIASNMKRARKAIDDFRPDVLVLVDYPELQPQTRGLCRKAWHPGGLLYISPQV